MITYSPFFDAIKKAREDIRKKTHWLCVLFGHKFHLGFRVENDSADAYYYCERCLVEEVCTTISFKIEVKKEDNGE